MKKIMGVMAAAFLMVGCGGYEGDSPETTLNSGGLVSSSIRPSDTCCGYYIRFPTVPNTTPAKWCAMQKTRGCTCSTSPNCTRN